MTRRAVPVGVFLLAGLVLSPATAGGGEPAAPDQPIEYRIRLAFAGGTAEATLRDSATSRDLVSRLPLSLTFRDFAGAEKIAVLDRKLATDGGGAAADGDVAYFAPWGNLALFYRGLGTAGGGLVILGAITAGKDRLAALPEGATVTLEALP